MAKQVQMRRGTEAEWYQANPILAQGEFAYAYDSDRIKMGNGVTRWADLHWYVPETPFHWAEKTPTGARTNSASTGFMAWPNGEPLVFAFPKRHGGTPLMVTLEGTWYTSAVGFIEMGVQLAGTNYGFGSMFKNETSSHFERVKTRRITGVPAGVAVNATFIVRSVNAGLSIACDSGDFYTIKIKEELV